MPMPGDHRPARLHVHLQDPAWDGIYAPAAGLRGGSAQPAAVPTIRRYLSLVFLALIFPLLVRRYGADPGSAGAGRPDGAGPRVGATADRLRAQGQGQTCGARGRR